MSEWLQFLIIAMIVLGIGVAIWRGGSANPTGTGQVGRQVANLKNDVTGLSARVGHIESDLEELKEEAATSKDIDGLRREFEGDRRINERTFASVQRIEQMLIERGLGDRK